MEKIDPSLVDNTLIFPDDKMLSVTWGFMALDDQQIVEYERDFANVTGG
jgi:spermidine/putrescine transport system substrate-binding protein